MGILILLFIHFFALAGGTSGGLYALPDDTYKRAEPYSTSLSLSGTGSICVPFTRKDGESLPVSVDLLPGKPTRMALDFHDSRDSRVFASIDGTADGPVIIGGALLSIGKYWIGAGPGRIAGPLASLSSLTPSGPIVCESFPVSLRIASDSTCPVYGFGTKNIAAVMNGKQDSGNSWKNASLVASGGNKAFRSGLVFSRIERDATFTNLGWSPSEDPEPARIIFRLASGISFRIQDWQFEWRTAFSFGRLIPRGSGNGFRLSWAADRISIQGGCSLADQELRNPDGSRIHEGSSLSASIRYQGESGSLFSFRIKSSGTRPTGDNLAGDEETGTSTEVYTDTESDTEGEGDATIFDSNLLAIPEGKVITWDGSCSLPIRRMRFPQTGSIASPLLPGQPVMPAKSGGESIPSDGALEIETSGRIVAGFARFDGRLGFRFRRSDVHGIRAEFKSKMQIEFECGNKTGIMDCRTISAMLGMDLVYPQPGLMKNPGDLRRFLGCSLWLVRDCLEPGNTGLCMKLSAGTKALTGKNLAFGLKMETDVSSLAIMLAGIPSGMESGTGKTRQEGIFLTFSLEGAVDTVR